MPKRQQKSKGNPASKRMINDALKRRRAASFKRGRERKAERLAAQAARERINRERGFTAWQQAKELRQQRRVATVATTERKGARDGDQRTAPVRRGGEAARRRG